MRIRLGKRPWRVVSMISLGLLVTGTILYFLYQHLLFRAVTDLMLESTRRINPLEGYYQIYGKLKVSHQSHETLGKLSVLKHLKFETTKAIKVADEIRTGRTVVLDWKILMRDYNSTTGPTGKLRRLIGRRIVIRGVVHPGCRSGWYIKEKPEPVVCSLIGARGHGLIELLNFSPK